MTDILITAMNIMFVALITAVMILIILQSYVEQDNKYQKRKLQERANELLAEAQNEN